MKILLLSDIHSNWAALQAIVAQESFDVCLCAGDIVDYGTDPKPCVDWIREHAALCVRGNHDHAVAQKIRPKGGAGLHCVAAAARPLHWQMLSEDDLDWLGQLPITHYAEYDEKRFFLVHATPRDPLDEYLGPQKISWEDRLREVEADIVVVGHTHQPYLLEVEDKLVLNPGSVGQPRDRDPRASYAIYEAGEIRIERIEYDIQAAVRQMEACCPSEEAIRIAEQAWLIGGFFSEDLE